jgi:Skp family chaperone for outer membrane proteins
MIRTALATAGLMLALPAIAQAQAQAPAAPPAPAASEGAGFLVMDSDRVATESTAMRSIFNQMAKRHDEEAGAYKMAVDKLDGEFAPIQKAKDTMDPAEYQKALDQYNAIKAQIDGVRKKVEDGMNAAGEKAIAQFNAAATEVSQQVRQEHGIARFVDGAAVLYIRDGSGYDVTDEVIKRLNARLPDVKVEFPPREPPAAAKKK